MWIQLVIIAICIIGLILTWTKNVKTGDKPINIAATVIAIIIIISALYSLFL